MKFIEHIRSRSPFERSFHAIAYEIIGIMSSSSIISFISGRPVLESGRLAIIVSLIAMSWNYLYNFLFDKLQNKHQFKKNLFVRILHGIGFEGGLILFSAPVIAFLFNMGLVKAFLLELDMLVFFLPYTIIYNWIYDKIRVGILDHYDKSIR